MQGVGAVRWLGAQTALGDEEIVRQVLAGAHTRFGELVRRHRARLRRVTASVLRDPQEAEDAVQQALLKAYAGLDRWAGTAPFGTWLARIALNEALMRARRSRRLATAALRLLADEEAPGTPEQEVASREAMERVEAAIPRLAPNHQEVLRLAAVNELPHADVAELLGVTAGAVKVRLHRAREALRVLVEKPGRPARDRGLLLAPVAGDGKKSGGPQDPS
jgi:RNA polymerase sigma-70 factor (ECF subfamily)